MVRKDDNYTDCIHILREELVPAMGCTEPVAIAYASALARDLLGAVPDRVLVTASGNIIKNVKSVIVPNTGGLKGIPAAAAAGIVVGESEKKLEAIAEAPAEKVPLIADYLEKTPIETVLADTDLVFDLGVRVWAGDAEAAIRIVNNHTNVVRMEKNGNVLKDEPFGSNDETGMTDRHFLTLKTIYDFAVTVDIEDVKDILDRQIEYNMAIAEEGMQREYGANIGKIIRYSRGDTLRARCISMAAAGSDARMNGCSMPVVINAGSGNQGMTVSVPLIIYAREKGLDQELLYRALVLSNLTSIYQKAGIGRLSAYCGAVNAGAAAACGIAFLDGADYRIIAHTLVNALAVSSGMICDGAKASCAGKIVMALDAGMLGYDMIIHGQQFRGGDGIVKKGVDNTIGNVGRLGKVGMRQTDIEILHMMIGE